MWVNCQFCDLDPFHSVLSTGRSLFRYHFCRTTATSSTFAPFGLSSRLYVCPNTLAHSVPYIGYALLPFCLQLFFPFRDASSRSILLDITTAASAATFGLRVIGFYRSVGRSWITRRFGKDYENRKDYCFPHGVEASAFALRRKLGPVKIYRSCAWSPALDNGGLLPFEYPVSPSPLPRCSSDRCTAMI